MRETYFNQVQLLVRLLAHVQKEASLALKGGTAINLFLRDMPRLSVDLDLVYVPIQDRATSLKNIDDALERIRADVERSVPGITVSSVPLPRSSETMRLIAASPQGIVKVEVSPVLRGSVFGSEKRQISTVVADQFGYVEANLLAVPDILAGKLCAALDRQHPRDIFDVEYILEAGVIDYRLRTAFLVYLISHNRPISELLAPNEKELDRAFVEEFDGMTREPITVERLIEIRTRFFGMILPWLTDGDREFLIGFKKGEPNWGHLGIDHVQDLPGVRWKLHNLERMTPQARRASVRRLEKVLERA
ncbi:MAG: nucleotidyl transferase AbiEii/AbiGii toxin family protein [Spirochaetaceae bacterium]|nr:MAG: nucleotidyl transferase AbiEii/AbiGii toxin family protein [Spirochaetaceae bacterium]